jgi:RNA polymerase sigma factor for flagellar operon FliA
MDIWETYKQTGDLKLRNQILEKYLGLVRKVAHGMSLSMPAFVNEDDLVSYGVFGLIDAVEKFDPERGFKFETYAIPRIRGSILDELRTLDWAPRSIRAKTNAIEKLMTSTEHGAAMTEREAAEFLGMSDLDFHRFKADEQTAFVASLDLDLNVSQGWDDNLSFADLLADERQSQDTTIEYDHILNTLVRTINLLPERERILVYLYYFEQMTLADIGKLMQVTESRVCQIHTSICAAMKKALNL